MTTDRYTARDRTVASVERALRGLDIDELLRVAEFIARLRQGKVS